MIKAGDADGEVAGAPKHYRQCTPPSTTNHQDRTWYQGGRQGFCLLTKASQYGANGTIVCGDCAVMPNPTAGELARWLSQVLPPPRPSQAWALVAMLSFSTKVLNTM